MFSKHFFYESTYGEGCFYEILNIDCLLFDFFKSFVKFNLTTNDVFARVGGINLRYVKCVRIWIFSGPYFPAFELNAERYRVPLRIQSKCRKMWTDFRIRTDFTKGLNSQKFLQFMLVLLLGL